MIEIEGGGAGQQPLRGDKDLGLKAGILFLRMKFGPLGWDMGLKAGIWVSSAAVGGRRRRNFKQRTDMAWCSCVAHDYNVLISMLHATCVPHLTYASDVILYSAAQMQPLNVALNDCIRRIFTYNRWESVRFLRLSFGYPSLIEVFESRSRKFLKQLSKLGNATLERLLNLYNQCISN